MTRINIQKLFTEVLDRELPPIPPEVEDATGGSGGEHEINWGDVSDVVKEALDPENIVRETMNKMQFKSIDEATKPLTDLSEYKEVHEKIKEVGEAIGRMLQTAFKEGSIGKDAAFGRTFRESADRKFGRRALLSESLAAPQDIDEAKESIESDQEVVSKYIDDCHKLILIFRTLAKPLEAPEIDKLANNIEKSIAMATDLQHQLNNCDHAMRQAVEQYDAVIEKAVNAVPPKTASECVAEISNLPAMKQVKAEAEKVTALEKSIKKIESQMDWTLDGFVGPDAGIKKKIDDLTPEENNQFVSGDSAPFGVIKHYTSKDTIESSMEDYE
jgi:hypothetical protein